MSYGGYDRGFQMVVESFKVGRIIGTKGAKIRQIQEDSNTKITVAREEDENGYKTVDIDGSEEDIKYAKTLIEECLKQDNRGGRGGYSGGGGGYSGGGGGRRDRDGGDAWGGRRSNDYDRGSRGGGGGGYGGDQDSIYVEKGDVGRLIGRGGSRIREIQEESGCRIFVAKDNQPCSEVTITGSQSQISVAKELIKDTGVEYRDRPFDDSGRGW